MFNLLKRNFSTKNSNTLSCIREERDELCETIINSSTPKSGFYLLLVLSTFIVTVGLLKNSIILTIGGMLVAPLLSPILSISLSLTIFNLRVFIRSIKVFLISTIASLCVSYFLGLIANFNIIQIELISFMRATDLTFFLIPMAAGAAASFTWAKKELNSSLPGVAVTVSLLPPLTVMGLSLSTQNFSIFMEALNIYLLNVSGIILGSLIIFIILGFRQSSKKIIREVQEESEV